jgi:subtilase family serine protease
MRFGNSQKNLISFVVVFLVLPVIAHAAGTQKLHGHVPAAVARLQPVNSLSGSEHLHLAIGLPLRNQAMLTELLQRIYNPASPDYRHYLTPEQFAKMFGPTEQDYQAVVTFAKTHGLTVTGTHPNRMLLDVDGSVTDIEKAMHVKMHVYRHPKEARTFYAPDVEPSLDLAVQVLHISGLNNYALPHPRLTATPLTNVKNISPNAGSGPIGTYMGNDFRSAYVPYSSLTGSGQVVGLVQFDGYDASDITYYESQAGLPNITLVNVLLDGFDGLPTGSGNEIEVCLDIEMVISMAPGLLDVIVYEAGPYGNWEDILNRMVTDNFAKQLSCSWYSPGMEANSVDDQIFRQMAAQGQSFFNASGDRDANTGLIDFPGDSPYITQAGGTILTTSGGGGAWVSETVWNDGDGNGSGGGISTQYPIPAWQTNINMTTNQGSTTMRNTPDVALTAYNVYVRADGNDYMVRGTSCASQLWAGFTALVNQQAAAGGRPTIGFINPTVYAIGMGTNYTSCFHDITTGNNTSPSSPDKFYAVAGYDLCTGWGTPAGQNLINALAGPSCGFTLSGDLNSDCRVDMNDFAILAENWLIDCTAGPNNPKCVPN